MPKRIVIIPEFASSHLLKCWIPNMIEVIEPDVIIINSGIFPQGPENKGHIDERFKEKYCWGDCGFDWEETVDIVEDYKIKYHNVLFFLRPMDYKSNDANQCFLDAISYFRPIYLNVGDTILSLEPDAFVHENSKETINEEIKRLSPGQGISCKWVDFLETQFYTENINISQPKYRRFAYCFDNMENYKAAMLGFMSQDYPKLKKVNTFFVHHYCWFVYGKWKELRYDLIYRSNPQYWKDFEVGLQEIRVGSERYAKWINYCKTEPYSLHQPCPISDKITTRPSRNDDGRFAKFFDTSHPKHIQNHPNFVK